MFFHIEVGEPGFFIVGCLFHGTFGGQGEDHNFFRHSEFRQALAGAAA